MKFGQMGIGSISPKADYIQLDICGLTAEEALVKYQKLNISIPIVLHGDWAKGGCSENNVKQRLRDYICISQALQDYATVLGFTMHPPFKNKVNIDEFLELCDVLSDAVPVFIENRSCRHIYLSEPEEIIKFSYKHDMTIDIPQLYISCGYNSSLLEEVLQALNWEMVKELHVANVKRQERHTFVARKICDGELFFERLKEHMDAVPLLTLEILGGINVFESQAQAIKSLIRKEEISAD